MATRLKMVSVQKRFGATCALRDVSFEVGTGEVHALIGENGAGKSTLMKVLSGACRPDAGQIELDGERFLPLDPLHARRAGIAMIYQELTLAPHLSVEENILLGKEPHRAGWIDRRQRRALAHRALAELRHDNIPLHQPVRTRPIAEQQIVEIARALMTEPKVLIMDEPTSSLTQTDTENLFAVIRRLKSRGVSVVYISHFLEECQKICDRYTVLRDGRTVATGSMEQISLSELIRLMVGREIKDIYPRQPHSIGEPILEVQALAGEGRPANASFVLRRGEILGIAGLVGAGRTETLRACFGLNRIRGGTISVRGRLCTRKTPAQRLGQGMGLLSENRKEEGLMVGRTIADNLTLTRYQPFARLGFIDRGRQKEITLRWIRDLGIQAGHPFQAIGELSGGNQQKVAMGRLLHHDGDIFLLDEPTRGIDVGSKAAIYRLINDLAAEGRAVVFVSSYLPELLGVCDNIAVMCRGVLNPPKPASEWTEHSIIAAAIGQGASQPGT